MNIMIFFKLVIKSKVISQNGAFVFVSLEMNKDEGEQQFI